MLLNLTFFQFVLLLIYDLMIFFLTVFCPCAPMCIHGYILCFEYWKNNHYTDYNLYLIILICGLKVDWWVGQGEVFGATERYICGCGRPNNLVICCYCFVQFSRLTLKSVDGFLAPFGTSLKASQLQLRLTGKGLDLKRYADFDPRSQHMVCMCILLR